MSKFLGHEFRGGPVKLHASNNRALSTSAWLAVPDSTIKLRTFWVYLTAFENFPYLQKTHVLTLYRLDLPKIYYVSCEKLSHNIMCVHLYGNNEIGCESFIEYMEEQMRIASDTFLRDAIKQPFEVGSPVYVIARKRGVYTRRKHGIVIGSVNNRIAIKLDETDKMIVSLPLDCVYDRGTNKPFEVGDLVKTPLAGIICELVEQMNSHKWRVRSYKAQKHECNFLGSVLLPISVEAQALIRLGG